MNKGDSKLPSHDIISCIVYEWIVDAKDCTTRCTFFIPWLDNDLPE